MKIQLSLLGASAAMLITMAGTGYAREVSTHPAQMNSSQVQTFAGEIARSPDDRDRQQEFILYDPSLNSNFYLDNNWDAAKYEGKEVQIKGTLDQKNDVIHVESIEPVQ